MRTHSERPPDHAYGACRKTGGDSPQPEAPAIMDVQLSVRRIGATGGLGDHFACMSVGCKRADGGRNKGNRETCGGDMYARQCMSSSVTGNSGSWERW